MIDEAHELEMYITKFRREMVAITDARQHLIRYRAIEARHMSNMVALCQLATSLAHETGQKIPQEMMGTEHKSKPPAMTASIVSVVIASGEQGITAAEILREVGKSGVPIQAAYGYSALCRLVATGKLSKDGRRYKGPK